MLTDENSALRMEIMTLKDVNAALVLQIGEKDRAIAALKTEIGGRSRITEGLQFDYECALRLLDEVRNLANDWNSHRLGGEDFAEKVVLLMRSEKRKCEHVWEGVGPALLKCRHCGIEREAKFYCGNVSTLGRKCELLEGHTGNHSGQHGIW